MILTGTGEANMGDMQEIVGRKIVGLRISDGEHVLVFDTDDGPIAYYAEGDCCSTSWFADILGVCWLLGGTVASVEAIDLPGYDVNDGRGRQEEDSAYGYKITTDLGYCDVVFRNSSNGYYGGWLELWAKELPKNMRPITTDWQA